MIVISGVHLHATLMYTDFLSLWAQHNNYSWYFLSMVSCLLNYCLFPRQLKLWDQIPWPDMCDVWPRTVTQNIIRIKQMSTCLILYIFFFQKWRWLRLHFSYTSIPIYISWNLVSILLVPDIPYPMSSQSVESESHNPLRAVPDRRIMLGDAWVGGYIQKWDGSGST